MLKKTPRNQLKNLNKNKQPKRPRGSNAYETDFEFTGDMVEEAETKQLLKLKPTKPLNKAQERLIHAIANNDIIFAIGVAGTAKSYIAVTEAVKYLSEGLVDGIIISRPSVEAGESLGFLPGDMSAKLHPYLIPIYDQFNEIISTSDRKKLLEDGTIEIAPLAYMRGRTFKRKVAVFDEMQNSTATQLKMALTRLGFGSKIIITADPKQSDLPQGKNNMFTILHKLEKAKLDRVAFVYFTNDDVVRPKLVADIIEALEKQDE